MSIHFDVYILYLQVELSTLVGAGRIKMSIIGQDVLVTRNEVLCLMLYENRELS